jgi:hypothetical protein
MNITVTVDEITLDTIVAQTFEYDEDGDPIATGGTSVAQLVADRIVKQVIGDTDRYPSLKERVTQIRDEEIRAAIRPAVQEAISRPIKRTNSYGEPTGPETTLSEVITDEARKYLASYPDSYNRDKGTVLQQTIRAAVKKAFDTEIADVVKKVRADVAAQIGATASEQITAAAMKALTAR